MKTTGESEKVRKGETAQERRGEEEKGLNEKERETARTDKRRSDENGEFHALSPPAGWPAGWLTPFPLASLLAGWLAG